MWHIDSQGMQKESSVRMCVMTCMQLCANLRFCLIPAIDRLRLNIFSHPSVLTAMAFPVKFDAWSSSQDGRDRRRSPARDIELANVAF